MYNNIFYIIFIFLIDLILKILSYTFIIIFFIFIIIILLYFIFLLFPIKYEVDIKYFNKKLKFYFIINRFLKIYYLEDNLEIKILGFKLNNKTKKLFLRDINEKYYKENEESDINEKYYKESNIRSYKKKDNILKNKKYKNFIYNFKLKIKFIKNIYYNYRYLKKIFQYIKKEIFVLLKRLIKKFKINYFNLTGEVGFKEPDITGKFLAIISMMSVFRQLDIKCNFNKEIYNINLQIKGKINISLILLDILRFIFSKKVFKTIIKLILNKNKIKEDDKNYV